MGRLAGGDREWLRGEGEDAGRMGSQPVEREGEGGACGRAEAPRACALKGPGGGHGREGHVAGNERERSKQWHDNYSTVY